MPRTGSQTITETGVDEASSYEVFDADTERLRPMVGIFLYAETEDVYVHIDGLHAADEFERILPYTPVERICMNPVTKLGSISRVMAYSAGGNGTLTWAPSMEWVN